MESSRPKVSICIPAYKQVEYLKKTLDSILIQTYKDYEIIISDDSPDNSVEDLVRKYAFGSKLIFFKNIKPLGSPENWNESIKHAKGEYIKILHHDDWFTYSYSLEEYVKLLDENPLSDFGFSCTNVFHADTLKERIHCISEERLGAIKKNPELLFLGNLIGGPSITIYRRSLNELYDNNMKWLVDIEFYIRAIRKNSFVAFTSNPLITTVTAAAHTVTTTSITKEVDVFEHFYLFDKIKSMVNEEDKKIYILHLWNLLKKHNIKSSEEIKQSGYKGEVGERLKKLLRLNRISSALSKLYLNFFSNLK
jgi:glycosyltransferase involved in cell wall biosynthesis